MARSAYENQLAGLCSENGICTFELTTRDMRNRLTEKGVKLPEEKEFKEEKPTRKKGKEEVIEPETEEENFDETPDEPEDEEIIENMDEEEEGLFQKNSKKKK